MYGIAGKVVAWNSAASVWSASSYADEVSRCRAYADALGVPGYGAAKVGVVYAAADAEYAVLSDVLVSLYVEYICSVDEEGASEIRYAVC